MIYTGYFTKHAKLNNAVSIALYTPKAIKIPSYKPLMPTKQILFKYKNDADYTEEMYRNEYYKNVLNKLDPKEIYSALDEHVLLCYEKSNDFCHRHIIAEWLNGNGYSCKELGEMTI